MGLARSTSDYAGRSHSVVPDSQFHVSGCPVFAGRLFRRTSHLSRSHPRPATKSQRAVFTGCNKLANRSASHPAHGRPIVDTSRQGLSSPQLQRQHSAATNVRDS